MPGPDPTRAAKRSSETRATISTPTTTTPALFAWVQLDRRRGLRRQAQRVDPVRQSQAGRRGSSPIELRQVGGQHRPHEFPHHELATKTGRSPTVAELAQYLELSIEDVLDGLEAAAAHHSSTTTTTAIPERWSTRSAKRRRSSTGRRRHHGRHRDADAARARAAGASTSLPRGPHTTRDRRADRNLTDADLADPATSDHNTERTNAVRNLRRRRPGACLTARGYRPTSLSTLGVPRRTETVTVVAPYRRPDRLNSIGDVVAATCGRIDAVTPLTQNRRCRTAMQ